MTPKTCMCGGTFVPFDFRIGNEKRGLSSPAVKLSGFSDPMGLECSNPECTKVYGQSDEFVFEPVMAALIRHEKHPQQLPWQEALATILMIIVRIMPTQRNTCAIPSFVAKYLHGGTTWKIVDKWTLVEQPHAPPPPPRASYAPITEAKPQTMNAWLEKILREAEEGRWEDSDDTPDVVVSRPPMFWDPAAYLQEDHDNDT